jgi:phage-related protein (TIGR01555 family)
MSRLKSVVNQIQSRADSWSSALTGLGNAMRDKVLSTVFLDSARLSDSQLEALYHGDDMAARVCDAIPEDALRKGFYLSIEDNEDSDAPGDMQAYMRRLDFVESLQETAIWSRVFGGAVLWLGIVDGQKEDQPVNMDRIETIAFVEVLDKRHLTPESYYDQKEEAVKEGNKFGGPRTYRLNSSQQPNGVTIREETIIHESRLLRLDGARTSHSRKARNSGWSDSVLQKVHSTIRSYSSGWQAVDHLMLDAAQGVFKIKNLVDMIAGGDKDTLQTRMELVDMSRSVARALMVDADEEDFTREAYNFAGVPDILDKKSLRLGAAFKMPQTVLMGQSPVGLNATGDSDIRLWYDRVQAYQTHVLYPLINRFFELVLAADDFPTQDVDEWDVKFERLWQMTDKEQADLEKTTAEKDQIYINAGVLLASEVAVNRFRARGFSAETQVDMDVRREILKAEEVTAVETAQNPPEQETPDAGSETSADE